MGHLRYIRLAEVCRLLSSTDQTLQAIAGQTGFCNEYHLGRVFRAQFGQSPGAWRKQLNPYT